MILKNLTLTLLTWYLIIVWPPPGSTPTEPGEYGVYQNRPQIISMEGDGAAALQRCQGLMFYIQTYAWRDNSPRPNYPDTYLWYPPTLIECRQF